MATGNLKSSCRHQGEHCAFCLTKLTGNHLAKKHTSNNYSFPFQFRRDLAGRPEWVLSTLLQAGGGR